MASDAIRRLVAVCVCVYLNALCSASMASASASIFVSMLIIRHLIIDLLMFVNLAAWGSCLACWYSLVLLYFEFNILCFRCSMYHVRAFLRSVWDNLIRFIMC